MADYGFKVFNADGWIQIDQDFYNFAVHTSGSSVTDTLSPGSYFSYRDITVTGCYRPVLALSSGALSAVIGVDINGTTWTFRVAVNGGIGTAFNWWCFDRPTMSNETYGLRVFRADGSVAFDSGNKYMRVIDQFDWAPGDTATHTYPSGRSYAVIGARISTFLGDSGATWVFYKICSKVSSNIVIADYFKVDEVASAGQVSGVIPPGTFVVLDVTGF